MEVSGLSNGTLAATGTLEATGTLVATATPAAVVVSIIGIDGAIVRSIISIVIERKAL